MSTAEERYQRLRHLLTKGGITTEAESIELTQLAALLGVKIQISRVYLNGDDPVIIYQTNDREGKIDHRGSHTDRRQNRRGAGRA